MCVCVCALNFHALELHEESLSPPEDDEPLEEEERRRELEELDDDDGDEEDEEEEELEGLDELDGLDDELADELAEQLFASLSLVRDPARQSSLLPDQPSPPLQPHGSVCTIHMMRRYLDLILKTTVISEARERSASGLLGGIVEETIDPKRTKQSK